MNDRLLVGRKAELEASDSFLEAASRGLAALVVEGEAGVGKTTVWDEIVRRALVRSYRVLVHRAVDAESGLSFAGLTDLLGDVDDELLAAIPHPQRRALEVALLRAEPEDDAPDRRAVFTGVVSLLQVISRAVPVVVAIDDIQWLDGASRNALAFAARRLERSPTGFLATVRSGTIDPAYGNVISEHRLTRLVVGPLELAETRRLLRERLDLDLPRPVLLRLHATAAGNPLYALEIGRALVRHGIPTSAEPLPVPHDLQQLVAERISTLPVRTQRALTTASALRQPAVDGSFAGLDRRALLPAEDAGLVRVEDGRVSFAHPLFASAVYAGLSEPRRRRLHRRLAESAVTVEQRAWHLLRSSSQREGDVTRIVDQAAERAAARGALEDASELAEEAARRTPVSSSEDRRQRSLRAARFALRAGDGERARQLAEAVLADAPPPLTRADALRVLAETCYRDRMPAARPLLEEARACAAGDARRLVQIEESLTFVAIATGDLERLRRHARRMATLAEEVDDNGILAEALALQEAASYIGGGAFDETVLQRALALEDRERRVPVQLRPSCNVAQLYEWTCRFERAGEIYARLLRRVKERGEESDLPFVLIRLAALHLLTGELEAAERLTDEAIVAADLVESSLLRGFALGVRAMIRGRRGHVEQARLEAGEALTLCESVGWPHGVLAARWTLGFLALAEDDHDAAMKHLRLVVEAVEAMGSYGRATAVYLPDAIEAMVALGELDRAEVLTHAIEATAHPRDEPWALAESARCHGLLLSARADLPGAASSLERAVAEHERIGLPFERGRALLALGRVQRRRRKKRLATEALERAEETFAAIGAHSWAEMAAHERARVGLRPSAPSELTATEVRVAELAASGLTNREIAARAFLTPKSVEDVVRRVYRKLDIRSRAELGAYMAERRMRPRRRQG